MTGVVGFEIFVRGRALSMVSRVVEHGDFSVLEHVSEVMRTMGTFEKNSDA